MHLLPYLGKALEKKRQCSHKMLQVRGKMRRDTVVRAKIDSDTKGRATEALRAMGLSVSDAIRLLLIRVADEQRLPFAVQVPNAVTVTAREELARGERQRFDSAKGLFRDLDI